jgi:nucleoside-diphosphate-sugar epimerase
MILVTGAGGYIGRHLVPALLAQGAAVRALDQAAATLAPLAALGAETVVADASAPAALAPALAGVHTVYHLAGSALGDREQVWRANVTSAETIIALCQRQQGLEALVYASSGAIYPSGDGWLDEETPPAPAFGYAQAKHAAEQVMLRACVEGRVPTMIARIAAVYGPASPALMAEQVRRGRFPLIGGGQGYASNIHIDDLVAALLAMPARARPGQIYNLADDEPAPVAAFYGLLAQLLGAPPPPSMHPAAGHALVWLVSSANRLRGRPAPLPADLVAMAAVSHRMCNRRMRDELGIMLRYPSYRAGLPAVLNQSG